MRVVFVGIGAPAWTAPRREWDKLAEDIRKIFRPDVTVYLNQTGERSRDPRELARTVLRKGILIDWTGYPFYYPERGARYTRGAIVFFKALGIDPTNLDFRPCRIWSRPWRVKKDIPLAGYYTFHAREFFCPAHIPKNCYDLGAITVGSGAYIKALYPTVKREEIVEFVRRIQPFIFSPVPLPPAPAIPLPKIKIPRK